MMEMGLVSLMTRRWARDPLHGSLFSLLLLVMTLLVLLLL
jgi:hypothetical protein